MKEICDQDWKEIKDGENLKVVDFYASWCGPCKTVAPILKELSEEIQDVDFYSANVEECLEASEEYGIRNVPTIILMKGGAVQDKVVGAVDIQRMRETIKKNI